MFKLIPLLSLLLTLSISLPLKKDVSKYFADLTGSNNYQTEIGNLPIRNGSSMFYQLVSAENSTFYDTTKPLVIWLQGGPGCSSMFGLYTEIGPFVVGPNKTNTTNFSITINPNTYAKESHLLFIDNPLGVGFSLLNNQTATRYAQEAALDFEIFLQKFFENHSMLKNSDLYLFGESYAGHYIPAFAAQILSNKANNHLPNIVGIAIGDGWTDPIRQAVGYDSYAYSLGLISKFRRNDYRRASSHLFEAIEQGKYPEASGLFDYVTGNVAPAIPSLTDGINIYNYRQYPIGNGMDDLSIFLNDNQTKQQFEIPENFNYVACNDTMYLDFYDDISRSYKENITYVLNQKNTKVLLYNGQNDIIVNTPSAENWIYSLKWDGAEKLLYSKKKFWNVNGKTVGTVKNVDSLTWVFVRNAGHMVPTDQPENAREMINRWINSNWE